jgi:hypothetical protein
MATVTTKDTKSTDLADLKAQRTRVASDLARALSVMNPLRYGEPSPLPDPIEVIEAPDLAARLQTDLRTLDAAILRADEAARVAALRGRDEAIAAATRLVQTELPALVRKQRALQREWQAFAARAAEVDHRAGGIQRAAGAACPYMLAGSGFDAFVIQAAQAFGVVLEP